MADPGYSATETGTTQPAASPSYAADEGAPQGLNLPLLLVMLLILVLVSLSNVWLRRRAEREAGRSPEDESR